MKNIKVDMDKITELKEMIVVLKMNLVANRIQNGCCPYTYYTPKRTIDCCIGCDDCRKRFMKDMERDIRIEVSKL